MKLKSLWIQEYKNLKDFQLDFEKGNHLSILIGNNGSGKSNVLEDLVINLIQIMNLFMIKVI